MAPRRQKKGGSTGAVAATPVRRSSRIQGLPAPIDSVNRATQPSKRRTLARRLEPRISLSLSPSPPLYVRKSTTPPTRSTPSLHSPAPAAASRIVASSSKTRHHQQQQHHDDSPGEEIGSHGYQFPHSNELDVATDSDIRPSIEYDIVQVDEQTDDNNPSYLVGEQPDSYDSYGSGANQAIHDDSPHRVDKPTSKNDTAPLDFDQADDSGPDDRRNMRADYGTGDDNEAGATSAHQDGADLQDQPQNNHDEARNFLRLTLSVQRRTDVQPQDIELHFYDDWTQLGSDRTLIMKFDAAEGGSRKRRRNLVDVAGEQFAEESEASPLEQVASPPERFLKRRRISRDSTAAEEQDSIAFSGADHDVPAYTIDLGRVDLRSQIQDLPIANNTIIPRLRNGHQPRRSTSHLRSLYRTIRQSLARLPAVAASLRDLSSRTWAGIVSKVFRLLEPIVRRPTRTAGVAVALAIALCIARSPSLVVPTFRELDYFEQTDIIFHLYSSIPSVLLFGDLDAINAVKGLYNLDLKIGEAKQDQHFDIASLPLSPPPSAYNTEANYVQEHIFIQDLIDATEHFFRQGSLSLTTSFLHPDDDTSAEQRQIHSASVEALRLRLRQALSRFQAEHDMLMSQVRLTGYNSMEAVSSHARARNAKLSKMQMAMDSPSKGYGGTDEARLACLWDELGNSENPATNALCDHTPRTHLEFALGQVNNVTVQGLLAIVMCHVVHFPGADARCDGITQPPSDDFSSFIPLYQERVQNLITELRQFVDQLRQTRREVYGSDPHPSHPCVTSQPSRLCVRNCSLREAEIMAEFLEDIAIPRLEYMEGNAAISTQIFSDAERRRRSVFDQVWPMANRYEQHGVIDWLKLSWPDFKLPVFPSLNALTNESNSARDRLNLMHDKFKACVHYVEQFDESSYKVNDVEKWFSNCTLECKPQYNPMLLSEDVSAEEIDAFLLNGTGLDMAASNESPRPSRWWEALFPWLIDQ